MTNPCAIGRLHTVRTPSGECTWELHPEYARSVGDLAWAVRRDDGVWRYTRDAGRTYERVHRDTALCVRLVIQALEAPTNRRDQLALDATAEVDALYPVSAADVALLDHSASLGAQLKVWKRGYWHMVIVFWVSVLAQFFNMLHH